MQPVPEGYMALDFIGFTDRGVWSNTEIYNKNDIVHKDNTAWRCLVDDTTGIAPSEGENWIIFMDSPGAFFGAYESFPEKGESGRFYIDDTVDPRLMYTWDNTSNRYVLTGGAGGADGSSIDIPLTLSSSGWTGETAPYSQSLTVPQMREGMTPLLFLSGTDDNERQYAYSLITGYEAGYASITFYAADMPEVDIDITLKGIPSQQLEFPDNTVVISVSKDSFTLDEEYSRYLKTISVPGMKPGPTPEWGIVRSGKYLSLEESQIAASITDIIRGTNEITIVCTEEPAQDYMLQLYGTFKDAAPGDVLLSGMQEWIERVEEIENKPSAEYGEKYIKFPNGMMLLYASLVFSNVDIVSKAASMYSTGDMSFDFSQKFLYEPSVQISGMGTDFVGYCVPTSVTDKQVKFRAINVASITTNLTVSATAIGRWK